MKTPNSIKVFTYAHKVNMALKFDSIDDAEIFASEKLPQALKEIVTIDREGNLIIAASKGRGFPGCYMTADGEVAINFMPRGESDIDEYNYSRNAVASFYKALTDSDIPELMDATTLQSTQLGFLGNKSAALYFNKNLIKSRQTMELIPRNLASQSVANNPIRPNSIQAEQNASGAVSMVIAFNSGQDATQWKAAFPPEMQNKLVIDNNIVRLLPSNGRGDIGCYKSANGEVSINFVHDGNARSAQDYYSYLRHDPRGQITRATAEQNSTLFLSGLGLTKEKDSSTDWKYSQKNKLVVSITDRTLNQLEWGALYFNPTILKTDNKAIRLDGQSQTPKYKIIMSDTALAEIKRYKQDLIDGRDTPGTRLNDSINQQKDSQSLQRFIAGLDDAQFIELLLSSKKPKIYAEAPEFRCDRSDWSGREFALLGKITISMDAKSYDNGTWTDPVVFDQPSDVHLAYIGAPLLVNKNGQNPEYNQIVQNGKLNQEAYTQLVREKLLPNLLEINRSAGSADKKAICTIPGWGVGQFAQGVGSAVAAQALKTALATVLTENGQQLGNIELIHMGLSRGESLPVDIKCGNIKFRVRNFDTPEGKTQLCKPEDYQEVGDNFSNYFHAKIVAADHISYTGNDAFVGSRWTDEGVTGFATNTMEIVTNIKGRYDSTTNEYLPPVEMSNKTWGEIVTERGIKYIANESNIEIYHRDGQCTNIKDVVLESPPSVNVVSKANVPLAIHQPEEDTSSIVLRTKEIENQLKADIIANTVETITKSLFGEGYTNNSGRMADANTIKEIVILAVKDQSVSELEINKNIEDKISKYIADNLTKSTMIGIVTGGIQLKRLTEEDKERVAKEFNKIIADEVPVKQERVILGHITPSSTASLRKSTVRNL